MATEIFINTDLKDLTANVVANKNRPTQVVRLPQIVEGETLDVELSLVNSNGGYDSRSGSSDVDLAVAVSAKGAAATSGTFTLTAATETTAPIAYNASGQAVQDALNALNSNTGAYGSTVVVTKLAAGSYRVIFDTVGARTVFGGTSIDLAPESEVVAATSVVGSSTIRAQQIIEISQQPAIYTSTWTTGSNKFTGELDANTARVQEFIAAGLEAYFEVKVDDDVISQVPVTVLPAVAAPNSLPAHTLPENIDEFAADPTTNGSFNVTNWLAGLLSPQTKAVWGYITGTLSNQTDLQSALDAKGSASDVSTNTSNISTNTSNIAANASDITTLQSDKAPLASPAFTGNPTAPTQNAADNSTKLATTAYVDAQSSPNNKGFFATPTALTDAYATGQSGWYAIVGTTDTFWVWDADTSAWLNTDSNSQGTVTSISVTGGTGLTSTGSPVTTSGSIAVALDTSTQTTLAKVATNESNIATNATNIASKAPTASPTFTGTANFDGTAFFNDETTFDSDSTFNGSVEFDDDATFNSDIEAEGAVFNDQVELAAGAEVSSGTLELTDGNDVVLSGGNGKVEMTASGKLKIGDLELAENDLSTTSGELMRLADDERTLVDQSGNTSMGWTSHDAVNFPQSTSKVGIRKSNPSSALDVNGTIKANALNVNSQKFYVDPSDDYIKAGAYGSGDFAAITGAENQPKTTPAFGNNGKVVEKTFIKTLKLQGTGFTGLGTAVAIVNKVAGQYIVPLEMSIFNKYGTRAGTWGTGSGAQATIQIGTFQNTDNSGNFAPFLTLPVSTANATGDWLAHKTFRNIEGKQFANRDLCIKGLHYPNSEANAPDGQWYIRVEYMLIGESSGFENNVDQTIGTAF